MSNNAPKQEDLSLVLEQLTQLSQDLANARMAQAELTEEQSALTNERDALATQVTELTTQCESLATKLAETRENIVFEKVQASEEEIKKTKEENITLLAKLEAATNALLDSESHCHQQETLLAATSKEREEARDQVAAVTNQLHNAQRRATDADAAVATANATLKHTQATHAAKDAARANAEHALKEAHRTALAQAHDQSATALATLQDTLMRTESERNSYKTKWKGVKKDLAKVLASVQAMRHKEATATAECTRLREELARKSRSLEDAMQALSMAQTHGGGVAPEAAAAAVQESQARQPKGRVARRLSSLIHAAKRKSASRMGTGNEKALREQVSEKTSTVDALLVANRELGARVLELEGKLNTIV